MRKNYPVVSRPSLATCDHERRYIPTFRRLHLLTRFAMSTVIEVDDIWKKYRLGIIGTGTLRHDFERWWRRVRGKPDPHAKLGAASSANGVGAKVASPSLTPLNGAESDLGDDEIWALRAVSFEVKQGEILGIIGRNGAGKSTLLKILSRVTSPTKGEVRIKGRIASLLEVGTGFHPELTGRENIFLNGAILGMTKTEIRSKLDEIVAFAEIDTYVDTPVKRYSSGMYVRLAFAVAAHLDPEILIVDEVLAVGDAEFQKKCIGKMKDVAGHGRTILFVSHNMDAIKQLCEKAILMNQGMIIYAGEKLDAVKEYQNRLGHHSMPVITGSKEIALAEFKMKNSEGKEIYTFNTFDKVIFELRYKSNESLNNASFALCFDDINGTRIMSLWSPFQNKYFDVVKGEFSCVFEIEQIHLNPGVYSVVTYAESKGTVLERIDNYCYITVGYIDRYGLVKLPEGIHGKYAENFNLTIS